MQYFERPKFITRSRWEHWSQRSCCYSRENILFIKFGKHLRRSRFLKSLLDSYMPFSFARNLRSCLYISRYNNSILTLFPWTKVHDSSMPFSSMEWCWGSLFRKTFWKTSIRIKDFSKKNNGGIIWSNSIFYSSFPCFLLHWVKIRWKLCHKTAIFRLLSSRYNLWVFSSPRGLSWKLFKEMHKHER